MNQLGAYSMLNNLWCLCNTVLHVFRFISLCLESFTVVFLYAPNIFSGSKSLLKIAPNIFLNAKFLLTKKLPLHPSTHPQHTHAPYLPEHNITNTSWTNRSLGLIIANLRNLFKVFRWNSDWDLRSNSWRCFQNLPPVSCSPSSLSKSYGSWPSSPFCFFATFCFLVCDLLVLRENIHNPWIKKSDISLRFIIWYDLLIFTTTNLFMEAA